MNFDNLTAGCCGYPLLFISTIQSLDSGRNILVAWNIFIRYNSPQ